MKVTELELELNNIVTSWRRSRLTLERLHAPHAGYPIPVINYDWLILLPHGDQERDPGCRGVAEAALWGGWPTARHSIHLVQERGARARREGQSQAHSYLPYTHLTYCTCTVY